MDIKILMQELNNASTKSEKTLVEEKIKNQFSGLSEKEKQEVQNIFVNLWNNKLCETGKKLEEIDFKIELLEISQYVGLSQNRLSYG